MEPIIAELAALQFMGSIVRAYNQIAEHNGQQAMIYQSKKQTEAGGCSIKKYFVMPANENWANFLQKIELPLVKIHSKDSYEHILDYDSISEKTRSDRYRCIAWANAKAAEICGKKGQLRPESVLAVASASLGAGGSGGAAAGGAAYAAFDGPQ
ncbi:MAG: hypothetical protein K0S29_1145 [Gammaproteobacteria bacterium]|nr:hypothetical protein [Gammaproteobacteria bacterium]